MSGINMKRLIRAGVITLIVSFAVYFAGCTSDTRSVSYTKDVAPLLAQKCVGCHSPNGTADFLPLDTYDNVRTTVNPGDSSNSRLVKSVDKGNMSGRITGDEVDLLKNWVNQGAKK